MSRPIKVGVIYGSTRNGRFCDKVANWAIEQIVSNGNFSPVVIDPAEPSLYNSGNQDETGASPTLHQRIAEADAFIVVTPEYNHGYPAPLKSLIDSVGAEWQRKPVAFVSYGGISGGLRAVEQLRQVFAELHAASIRESVSFASAWEQFDSEGILLKPERAQRSMAVMLADLHWWSVALRNARNPSPNFHSA